MDLGTDQWRNRMITKEIIEDKIEIIGDYKNIQVRTATVIKEDGVEITRSFQRHILQCTDNIRSQSTEIQGIAAAVWTDKVKAAYQNFLDSNSTLDNE